MAHYQVMSHQEQAMTYGLGAVKTAVAIVLGTEGVNCPGDYFR